MAPQRGTPPGKRLSWRRAKENSSKVTAQGDRQPRNTRRAKQSSGDRPANRFRTGRIRRRVRTSMFPYAARSIARLQDPLAELVKSIRNQSASVGISMTLVERVSWRKLDAVVEDCVNAVGVDLNTASVGAVDPRRGLTRMMAQNIVFGATRTASSTTASSC